MLSSIGGHFTTHTLVFIHCPVAGFPVRVIFQLSRAKTEISTELGMASPISLSWSWLSGVIQLVSRTRRLSTIFKNLFVVEVPSSMLASGFFCGALVCEESAFCFGLLFPSSIMALY